MNLCNCPPAQRTTDTYREPMPGIYVCGWCRVWFNEDGKRIVHMLVNDVRLDEDLSGLDQLTL